MSVYCLVCFLFFSLFPTQTDSPQLTRTCCTPNYALSSSPVWLRCVKIQHWLRNAFSQDPSLVNERLSSRQRTGSGSCAASPSMCAPLSCVLLSFYTSLCARTSFFACRLLCACLSLYFCLHMSFSSLSSFSLPVCV